MLKKSDIAKIRENCIDFYFCYYTVSNPVAESIYNWISREEVAEIVNAFTAFDTVAGIAFDADIPDTTENWYKVYLWSCSSCNDMQEVIQLVKDMIS